MKQFLALLLSALIIFTSCTNYGKKAKSGNIEVYYKDGVTKEEAQKTADLFLQALQSSNPDDKTTKSFQLSKTGDTALLKMVVADKEKMNAVGDVAFYAIAGLVSDSIYNGKPVNISLTNNKFKPFKTLTFNPAAILNFGTKAKAGNIEVYAKNDFSLEHAQMLADFLSRDMNPASVISFQVDMPENDYYQVYMASNPDKAKALSDIVVNDMCVKLSDSVFYGAGLVFHFTDDKFKPFRTYNYNTAVIDSNAVK
ncbi:MAG: hypothetical protein IPH18_05820 [Chitinophagaceae bacterium]|nr:hypothetical protein [Chitinophagaceae bacterium]MBK8951287.1 hypothetical protein [Chitinophagaceae bacterium]